MYILPVILIKNKTSRNKVNVLESVFRMIKNKYLNLSISFTMIRCFYKLYLNIYFIIIIYYIFFFIKIIY